MQIKKEIYNVVKSKFKTSIIIAITLVCILIFPTVIIENTAIPTSNENLFYLGEVSDTGTFNAINNATPQFSWNFVLLNHRGEPLPNTTIFGCSNIAITTKTINKTQTNIQFFTEVIPVTAKTNSFGMANFTVPYLISVASSYNELRNFTILSFNLQNYSVSKAAWEGTASPKYNNFGFSSSTLQNKNGNITKVYFSTITSNLLGYYGRTPVIMVCGNSNTPQPVNISYKLYNPQNAGKSYTYVNLTKLKNHQIYTVQNYSILKEFNMANNVTFYGTGDVRIGSLFYNSQSFFSINGAISSFLPAAEIALLVALLMVLIIYTPMFNNNIYKRYLSLPEQRKRTVLVQLVSSVIVSSIFTGIALGVSYILAYVLLRISLAPIAILYTFVIIETAFFVFESIYTILSAHFPGRNGIRTFMTVFLVFGYPLISSIASSLVVVFSFTSSLINVFNYTYLFEPTLEKIRTYNILTSILPVLNVEQFNNYLLREPFSGVVMYNHLNLFDLSPIIFISSIIGFSALFIYLGIRKFERI